jgi:type II secretory pathway pseudopilin PulG
MAARSFYPQFRGRRGFTLVELMVAMTGGLFLSIIVFALSRDATRFYQQEGRVANATLASVTGFERLSADVSRAGHLSTANVITDTNICNRPGAGAPATLFGLRALVVGNSTVTGTEVAGAGIKPRSILVSGALNVPELLTTRAVAPDGSGGGWRIDLQLASPAAARLGLAFGTTTTADLDTMFKGKIVRVRGTMDYYGVVDTTAAGTNFAYLNLSQQTPLVRSEKGLSQCGINGIGEDMAVSVIDVVRYDIRSMTNDTNYSALFKASGLSSGGSSNTSLPYESGRTELVRVELDKDGNELSGTREIIGEYAVDLQLSAWGATSAASPTIVAVDPANITSTYTSMQLLRGVHLRLSVRSREADRDANLSTGGSGNFYRIGLGTSGGAPFARVRTLQTDVPLRNLEGSR